MASAMIHVMRRYWKRGLPLFISFILLAGQPSTKAAQNQNPTAAFERAVQLQQSGDLDGAVRAYREFLQAYPQNVEALSNLGAIYAHLGRYSDAIAQYKLALDQDSHNVPIHFNLALAYYKSAQFPEAATQLEIVRSAQPDNERALLLLADCDLQMGENKKIIGLLSPIESHYDSNQAFLYLLGTALIRERQPEGQVLVDKILRNGESAEAHMMLGTSALMASQDLEALKEFKRAIELNPTILSAHSLYGHALLDTGNRPQAMEAFRSELRLNPNDYESNFYVAVILKQDQKFKEALGYFKRALEIRPQALDARYQIGSLYLATGDLAEAQQILEELVKVAPNFVEAHVSLASVYYRLKRKSEGDRERAIISKLTQENQAHMSSIPTGEVHPKVGASRLDPSLAKTTEEIPPPSILGGAPTLESGVGVSPSGALREQPSPSGELKAEPPSKPTFDELVSRAAAAREAGRDEDAIDLYGRALKLNDSWPEGWWYLGTLYYGEDRFKEGRDAFARLAKLEPKRGAGPAMLGLCEFRLHEYDLALEHLERARTLGLPAHDELTHVVWYHAGLLLNRVGEPEAALQVLFALAREQEESPHLLEALGLAGLEVPKLPAEIPLGELEKVRQAGRVEYFIGVRRMAEARTECEKLMAAYPDAPNVHYMYGVVLLDSDPDGALREFRSELQSFPSHVRARLQIAFEYLRRGDFDSALPFAEQAMAMAPKLPASHYAMGRILFQMGENDRAIVELEEAAKLAPDSPEVHFALFGAYAKAQRKSEALRERQIFADLEKRKAKESGATSSP